MFCDGSGGPDTAGHRKRRVGWATVEIYDTLSILAIKAGTVQEGKQTVPVAEMNAMIEALGMAQAPIVIIYTDSKIVYDGFLKKTHKGNQRRWKHIQQEQDAAARRGCKVICNKIKSHDTEAVLKGGMDEIEWFGNMMADGFAG